jgi:acid phosphatase type 7
MIREKYILIAIIASLSWITLSAQSYLPTQPRQVVLTWQQDPTTTMTITWRTDSLQRDHRLHYIEKQLSGTSQWKTATAASFTFEETSAWLHTVELTQLKPNHEYAIVIEHPNRGIIMYLTLGPTWFC